MALSLPILLVCVIAFSTHCHAQNIIHDIIPDAITDYPDYDGYPATYEQQYFNVTGLVYLNITTDAFHDVKIQIKLPNTPYTSSSCDYLVDGSQTSCSFSNNRYTPIYADTGNAKLTFGAGLNSTVEPAITFQNGYIVEFEVTDLYSTYYNTSDFDSSVVTVEETIFVTVPVFIKPQDDDSLYKFIVKVIVNNGQEDDQNNVKVHKIGPYMRAVRSSSPSMAVEAGDTVFYTVHFEHVLAVSTENATNVRVSVAVNNAGQAPAVSGSVRYETPSGSADLGGSDIADMQSGITVGAVNVDGFYTLTFTCNATDNLLLNSELGLYIELDFDGVDSGQSYSYNYVHSLSTATVNFTASPDDITLDSDFPVGAVMTIKKLFAMPKGLLQGFTFFADFYSSELSNLPFTFINGVITHENHVDFTESHNGVLGATDFVYSNSRKRRSVDEEEDRVRVKRAASGLGVTAGFGDILNPAIGGVSGSPMELLVQFSVGDVPLGGAVDTDTGLDINGNSLYLNRHLLATVNKPYLTINKTVEMVDYTVLPNIVRFNVTVEHTGQSNNDAYDVVLQEGDNAFDVYFRDEFVGPSPGDPGFTVVGDRLMTWEESQLGMTQVMHMSYKAQPSKDGKNLPKGQSYYEASATYQSAPGSNAAVLGPVYGWACVEKVEIESDDKFIQYGFTVLALICGFILGALIVVLILFICYKCRLEMPFTSVRPTSEVDEDIEYCEEEVMRETSKGLMTDPSFRKKKGFNTIKDLSVVGMGESIIKILALKDKMKRHRELDNLDIVNTIHVDEKIDEERNNAMIEGSILLVHGLRENGDIPKATEEKAVQAFRKNIGDLEKNTNKDYEKDLEALLKKLGAKNQQKLASLMEKQHDEKETMEEKVSHRTPEEQKEILDLVEQRHQSEREELAQRLKLEQDEETEKLRKEFVIRKRMGIKEQQQRFLDDIQHNGGLKIQQADWLMKEHLKTQSSLEKIYDDEISRQRMALEEKLARRKALAAASEQQEEHQSETLNTLASQQLQAIQRAKKEGTLSNHEARIMMEKVQKEMVETKERMDKERERQEQNLHKKLSDRKKQRMEALAKKHQQEVNDLQKTQKSQQTDGAVDPISFLEAKSSLIARERTEMNDLENEVDEEHATELHKLRDDLGNQTQDQLGKSKADLMKNLQNQGMSLSQINKILAKHDRELRELSDVQQSEKERQHAHFMERLARSRAQGAMQQELEGQEQEALRSHEDAVVRRLMDNQVAMSELERDRILQEHEKQMVTLENSLTLNKLQQKRMLEDKLAHKRNMQLEKLQRKQQLEAKKRKRAENEDYDMDDEERHQAELDVLRRNAEQKLAIIQGEKLKIEDENEAVREEMMRERAGALKEQEVRLGAMLAQLQMDKAKEMAKIEEQQKAIHNLKSNLMDDLNDKGVLSDPECQRVIEIHQQEQEQLNQKLDAQRLKQEKKLRRLLLRRVDERERMLELQHREELLETEHRSNKLLKKKLAERLRQKEDSLSRMHEQQLQESTDSAPSGTAGKLRRMALMTRHMTEMEQFRNHIEKEISQTLEEMRRQNEIKRMNMMQDQEIQFINGLVRLGKFKVNELDNVVHLLFPAKTEEEQKSLLDKLCEGYKAPPESETEGEDIAISPRGLDRRKSTLEARALSTALSSVESDMDTGQYRGRRFYSLRNSVVPEETGDEKQSSSRRSSASAGKPGSGKRRLKGGKKKLAPISQGYDDDDDGYSRNRPDPVGRSYSPNGYNENERYGRVPPTRLPPMQSSLQSRKKKKKGSVTYSQEADF